MGDRSLSLPDITSFAARAHEEEAKRQKRLARNRASARLRRLRKKNLVDSYEGEVGVLERALQKLKAHEWGKPGNHPDALIEALGMDRGQQPLTKAQRQEQIVSILNQQIAQVQYIQQAQLELRMLQKVVDGDKDDEMTKELAALLQLTDEQKHQLSTIGNKNDSKSMDTVLHCLHLLNSNQWLQNNNSEDMALEPLLHILHPGGQVSKFLLWTDANADAISQLDHVFCNNGNNGNGNSPVFVFGMDDLNSGSSIQQQHAQAQQQQQQVYGMDG